jgi:anti-sigma B factor antagonist
MQLEHHPLPDGSTSLRLSGELTIYHAGDLKQALLPLAEQAGAWALDLSGVTDIDSAGIQVLLAARRTLAARGAMLRLTARSATAHAAFALYGMAHAFGAAAAD